MKALPLSVLERSVQLSMMSSRDLIARWEAKENGRVSQYSQWCLTEHDAFEVVDWAAAEKPDNSKIAAWLAKNKVTVEMLVRIVSHAKCCGVAELMSQRANARHSDNRKKTAEIPERWAHYKREGRSKGWASSKIAAETGLKESTVRRRLQGL